MPNDRSSPEWVGPDGLRASGSLIDQRPPSTAQKLVQTLGVIVWIVVATTMIHRIYEPSIDLLERARQSTSAPSLWFQPSSAITISLGLPVIAGGIAIILNIQLFYKLVILILIFAALILASALATRPYTVVTNDQVLIHPALPWRHDVRFSLGRAVVTARGCNLWHGKSSTHHEIIFKVRDAAGSGTVVDLGGAAARDVGAWLTVMRDYGNGVLPLTASAGANAPHDQECMRFWLDGLSPEQQAELNRLLN